ncbi:outer membrane beta-barrel protein [uncultured Pelagimonas sp.]|uniref:outer membrane protein n=1 Tax=uncultured Pelagimonas sp. TaxID=1618102 RepID=UPI00263389AA|nr:outer membrane beta-barrel protein [uncultured Pelagimonas sp.]
MRNLILSAALIGASTSSVLAEVELSIYTGWQTAPHSRASGDIPDGDGDPETIVVDDSRSEAALVGDVASSVAQPGESFNELLGWEGKSNQMPPYYGVRATWWQNERIGYGIEFSHNKVYAVEKDREKLGFSRLELTDGLNIVTLNVSRRWKDQWGALTPYVSGGLGVAIPHVDAKHDASGSTTFGYQVTGPALRMTAGASYALNDKYSIFGEYQFTYSSNDIDLDGGGSFKTDIKTNALNIGVSYSF